MKNISGVPFIIHTFCTFLVTIMLTIQMCKNKNLRKRISEFYKLNIKRRYNMEKLIVG